MFFQPNSCNNFNNIQFRYLSSSSKYNSRSIYNIHKSQPRMAQYDLTNALSEFMDLHLVFPLLEFLSTREIYKSESLMKSKYQLLQVRHIFMFSFLVDC